MHRVRPHVLLLLLGALVLGPAAAIAESKGADATELRAALEGLGAPGRSGLLDAITELGILGDPRAIPALRALEDKRLRVTPDGRVLILDEETDTLLDPIDREEVSVSREDLDEPMINNRVRRALAPVIAQLQLRSDERAERFAAAEALERRPIPEAADAIRAAVEVERDASIRRTLNLALAQIDIESDDPAVREHSVELIGEYGTRRYEPQLRELLATNEDGTPVEPNEPIRAAAAAALKSIGMRAFWADVAGNFFYGLSLASVLLLAALGLAITFGLMRVINMAHGEMLMLGAYTSFVVQNLFLSLWPAWFDAYVLAAIPAAFVVCGLVGMALERGVIRHLYGRPLETLLATWGISLILIQTVRLMFGAQNVEVANPAWLSGGFEIFSGIVLPFSRIGIVFFAVAVVGVVWFVLQKTPLGLHVRAVTQNREMASCVGIPTARVDMWTFGLGSAIAGLGGVALSQIGNVGPELGQGYIVDSFLVVVIGGVGKIAGCILAALSLGLVNKFLEPVAGAVFGKILVLIFIIVFIQRRPQGIFALRGRAAEI